VPKNMARKRRHEEKPAANWLTTYGDMVTLLLTFFVLLFSMSTVSPGKFQQVAVGLRTALTGKPPSVLTGGKSLTEEPLITSQRGIYQELIRIAEEYQGKITIEEKDEGTVIVMKNMAFFYPGSARLTAEAKELLGKIGSIVIEHTNNVLQIYGYADDRPVPSDSIYVSNWHLSAARASSVVSFFTEELKKRRSVEKLADIRAGRFDPEYFYDGQRFYPIGMGDWMIKNQIKAMEQYIDTQKANLKDELNLGNITEEDYTKRISELDKSLSLQIQQLRDEYRRIDILIKRERAK